MKILDISWSLSNATVEYKDKKTIEFEQVKKFDRDGIRETCIRLCSHSGTHVDAPAHFLKDGETVDNVPLESCIGDCIVLDMTNVGECITAEHLEIQTIREGDIVLLKTTNSALKSTGNFNKDFVYFDVSGAHYLVEQKIRAVGIDYLGIERGQKGHLTHWELFTNNITIIEGLRLETVEPGAYFLCCLSLSVIGLEAAPARAVLIQG
jgi:arylformamidase